MAQIATVVPESTLHHLLWDIILSLRVNSHTRKLPNFAEKLKETRLQSGTWAATCPASPSPAPATAGGKAPRQCRRLYGTLGFLWKLGLFFVGACTIRALVFGVCIRTPTWCRVEGRGCNAQGYGVSLGGSFSAYMTCLSVSTGGFVIAHLDLMSPRLVAGLSVPLHLPSTMCAWLCRWCALKC